MTGTGPVVLSGGGAFSNTDLFQCENCLQPKAAHSEDGRCLFGPSSYKQNPYWASVVAMPASFWQGSTTSIRDFPISPPYPHKGSRGYVDPQHMKHSRAGVQAAAKKHGRRR